MATSVQEVVTAIYSKLTGNAAFNTAMDSRIAFEEYRTTDGSTPKTLPYCVVHVISEVPSYTYTSQLSEVLLQVSIFDNSESGLPMLGYLDKLYTVLDDTTLTMTTWTFVKMFRESAVIMPPDDDDFRHAAITYRVEVYTA